MISLASPRTRVDSDTPSALRDPPPYTPTHSRVSSFRSPQLEVLFYCPAVKTVSAAWSSNRTIPVYGDHDVVGGKIIVDPSCRSGRVILTISGTVVYNYTQEDIELPYLEHAGKRKHVFFFRSAVIEVTSSNSNSPRSGFSQVFKRRQTVPSLESDMRAFPFSFEFGRRVQAGDSLPPTFSSFDSSRMPFEISYQVTATWEPLKLTHQSSLLTIPIVIRPDPDFQSVDAHPESRISWLEIPLKSQRPVPFRCAITVPSALTFPRTAPIPFFVVFTTVPRSKTLAREIATDATISISVSRHMSITEGGSVISSTPESIVSDAGSGARPPRFKTNMIKRIKSRTSLWSLQSSKSSNSRDLPPEVSSPQPPRCTFSETRIIYNGMCIGFPKRPRLHRDSSKTHPSLEAHHALPDGLHKGAITLNRNMLASIDWGGISLKYYLEVSVLVGQDELRTKFVLRIT
ncbi:hypothetical protein B0H17DRAFT_1046295 [Mycena rosella]|uniref:Uncharacterized protein n=1 Tax=Mycena rosella TaxID=1033263 RepID=A0AAD7GPI9_MYCRO|nr:hypothetical protein B0H17DRAFT_1046295 [Mycena rosella]